MIDYHTHILPGMDDGARDEKISFAMLQCLKEQGVTTVCLTPHFYRFEEELDTFLERRQKAFDIIQPFGQQLGMHFVLGSEVYFDETILYMEDLHPLCFNGGRYMLLELPFDVNINQGWVQKIVKLKTNKQIIPIIAHVDRYPQLLQQGDALEELLAMGCKIQMNLKALDSGFFQRRKWIQRIKEGQIHAVGSDCHNMETRPPMYAQYIPWLKKHLAPSVFGGVIEHSPFFSVSE